MRSVGPLYQPLAIAVALGLLVGLQRESRKTTIAGLRTFPLITVFGCVMGLLDGGDGWTLTAAGLLVVAAFVVMANMGRWQRGTGGTGLTTEMSILVMYGVGVLLALGHTGPSLAVAGATAVLLHWKQRLHGFVEGLGERDLRAVMNLALVALVILPVLPDRTYGPYDVLNPREIWLMVVLIAGISMAAYVAYRLLGARVGAVLGGILGGLISSTATTVSYARQARERPGAVHTLTLVILIASAVVNVRVLGEIAVVSPGLFRHAVVPVSVLLAVMAVECVALWFLSGRKDEPAPPPENPTQLKAAIVFGLLYAVILFAVAATREHFGSDALYAVAALSGLTDVDAITLSTANLYEDDRVAGDVAWRVVVIALMSNLVFKLAAVGVLGGKRLFVRTAVVFGIALAVAGLSLVLLD